ncbi:hypothetical protein ACH427_28345 [Streptomyces sp. NPDC020379]|uniref:hypothetical protein n=1 Tax=Streptomyces sp. NPDC020379 TaxID=3365071 RepID=UPI0037A7695C
MKTPKPLKAAALLAVPLVVSMALGAAPTAAHAAGARPAAGAEDVTLANADNGRQLDVTTGDGVKVRLTGSRSQGVTWAWSVPTSGSPSFDRTAAGTSRNGDATATFRAVRPGTAEIEAYQRCIPDPGHFCAQVIIPWKVTFTVKEGARAELSLLDLIGRATNRVRESDPQAVLMVAAGDSPSGPTRDMAEVTHWRFVFNNRDNSSAEISGDLDGTLGPVTEHKSRWVGALPVDEEITMTPAQAYDRLVDAGHGDAFRYVSLVKPMGTPPWHLQYHFSNHPGGCDGYAVFVGSGGVSPICGK